MATSPLSTVQAARETIAGRLRELRLDAGLTGDELSRRCGWHAAKTSRIEHTKLCRQTRTSAPGAKRAVSRTWPRT
ncbi:helix-turn-helix domain-containing protein [Streptacidiphilus neutrinimicus]|uniref:helix-turn-helix domain-containing protein n=1 Tax=Streptacidiphilus neutrinimicus TaxID=105420 RepID=UPI0034E1FA60